MSYAPQSQLDKLSGAIRKADTSNPETVERLVRQLNFHLAKTPRRFEVALKPDGTLDLFQISRTKITGKE